MSYVSSLTIDKCYLSVQLKSDEILVYVPVSTLLSNSIVYIVVQYISFVFKLLLLISKNVI